MDKRQYLQEKCTCIKAHHCTRKSKSMYTEIKHLTREFTIQENVIKSENSKVLTETTKFLGRWYQYCSKLYSDYPNKDRQATENEIVKSTKENILILLRSEVE